MSRTTLVVSALLVAALAGASESERPLAMARLDMAAAEKPGEKKTEQAPVGTWSAADQAQKGRLYEEALRAAPILWFSDDEPLLRVSADGSRRAVPAPLPCDAPSGETPIVYYELDNVRVNRLLTPDEKRDVREGNLPLDSIVQMRINYHFYYPEDSGLNPHIHDIETVSVELDVDREEKDGKAEVKLNRVTGWAHGNELLANILQIKPSIRSRRGAPDTRLPVTILVEEGKHASCPDMNGDGVYTPGVDVTVRVADAWGVRDVFGSGVIGSRYQSFMTKSRLMPATKGLVELADRVQDLEEKIGTGGGSLSPAEQKAALQVSDRHEPGRYRIGPQLPAKHEVLLEYEKERRANGGLEYPSVQYELRDITKIPEDRCTNDDIEAPCPRPRENGNQACEPAQRLKWSEQGHIFEAACPLTHPGGSCGYLNLPASIAKLRRAPPINRIKLTYKYGRGWPIQPFRNAFVGVRYDRGAKGLTAGFFSGYGLPKFGGWFNAGATAVRRDERWDWATNLWFTPSIATLATWYAGIGYDHRNDAIADRRGHFAFEGGVQVRHSALGLRLGLRSTLSAGGLRNAGVVSEIVFGPAPKGTRVH